MDAVPRPGGVAVGVGQVEAATNCCCGHQPGPTRYLNKYKKKTQSKATFGLLSLHSLLVNIGVEAKLCSSVAAETA